MCSWLVNIGFVRALNYHNQTVLGYLEIFYPQSLGFAWRKPREKVSRLLAVSPKSAYADHCVDVRGFPQGNIFGFCIGAILSKFCRKRLDGSR